MRLLFTNSGEELNDLIGHLYDNDNNNVDKLSCVQTVKNLINVNVTQEP